MFNGEWKSGTLLQIEPRRILIFGSRYNKMKIKTISEEVKRERVGFIFLFSHASVRCTGTGDFVYW